MDIDLHVHSDNSPDGENSVMKICESSIAKGLSFVAVTDHCEIDCFYKDSYDVGYRQSYFEVKKATSVFDAQINLLMGVELGQATSDLKIADTVTSTVPYDIILGSMHCIPGYKDFAFLDYSSSDPEKLFSKYLAELYNLACWGGFDVLTHLTYPLRYINGEHGFSLEPADFSAEIEKVLKEIIKRGIALEINASGLRQKYGKTMPDLFCLKLYKKLGGELLTFGSDAHRAEDVGKGIGEAAELAREAGFSKCCIFRQRKPELITF